MNLCYIISDIDKAVYFEETAIALRDKGLEPNFVLINCKNGALECFLDQHKFDFISLEASSLVKSRMQIIEVKNYLKKTHTTVVHCHLAFANWIGLWAAKWAGVKKRIYTRHSGEPLNINWKEKLIDKIQNRLATKIIAITQMIDDLLEKQGVPKYKRQVIHHGFVLERFANPESAEVNRIKTSYNSENAFPIIGVNARWMEWKGIQFIIPAFKKLLKDYPNAKLALFGASSTADYFHQINELLENIPEQNKLIVPFENNVFALYQLFDVYVHVPVNATCEAFGQTYVEALAAGIPSVFTLSGIAHEFIRDKENALVIDYCDTHGVYNSIKTILESSNIRHELIENGIKSTKPFQFETYIQNLINCYSFEKTI